MSEAARLAVDSLAMEHICHFYTNQEERWKIAIRFVTDGIANQQQVLVCTQDSQGFLQALTQQADDLSKAIASGEIIFLHPENMLQAMLAGENVVREKIHAYEAQALERGLTGGIRILGDATWLQSRADLQPQWAAMEDLLLNNSTCPILCQYNQYQFPPSVALEILKAHPLVAVNDGVLSNPYYEAREEVSAEEKAARTLDRALNWLQTRKHTEDALIQNEKYFRALYEKAPLAYQSLDINGNILTVNNAWCDMMGFEKEEVIGRWWGEFISPSNRGLFRTRFEGFKKIGEIHGAEFEMVRKDGEIVIASAEGRIARHADGSFKRTHCILANVTDRKKVEQVMQQSQKLYQALFENNREMILLIDPETGGIVTANPSACEFYGYSLAQFTGMKISQINTLSEAEVATEMELSRSLEKNTFTFQHRLANGEIRDVETLSGPIDLNGYPLLYSIVHDVTRHKRAEEEAKRLNVAMQQRMIALVEPVQPDGKLKFEDLFNIEDIQAVQDAFADATGVAAIITDVDGTPITRPSNFCRLCSDLIRKTPKGLVNCMRSDAIIGQPNGNGATISPCHSVGLVDAGASIMVGDHHIANWLIGQVATSVLDTERILEYSREVGADEQSVLSALPEITRMSAEQFKKVSNALYSIANQLSKLAIQNVQLARTLIQREKAEEKIEHQFQRLTALRTIDTAINAKLSLSTVMEVVLDQAIEQLGVSAADILLFNPEENQLLYGTGKGFYSSLIDETAISFGEGIAGYIAAHQIPLKIEDLSKDEHFSRKQLLKEEKFSAYHGAPLVAKGAVLGVLEVFHRGELKVENDWVSYFETLAGQAAIAIDDAYMYDGLLKANQVLSQAYDETIEGWSRALDLRDHETEGHSRRVMHLSLEMAKAIGIPEEMFLHIRRGALLHDIGKVGVPDQILLKPGKLNDEEWRLMKLHPQYSYDLLSPISFLHPALDIPHYHHEKWDGTGYPSGLKGTDIPLAARIFAVVDVWDALRSDRPYRKGWTQEAATEYIREQSGKHFDPEVVETFLNLVIHPSG